MSRVSLEKKSSVVPFLRLLGRFWAVLVLGLAFLGLWWSQNQWAPRAVYGAVVVQTGENASSTRLNIYTPGSQNQQQCEIQLKGVLSSLNTLCPVCQVQHYECSKQPSNRAIQALGGLPLLNPSVRMPNGGVVEYQAENANFALQACRETEAQSKHALRCTPPHVERVFSLDALNPWMGMHHMQQAYLGLALLLGLLMLAVLVRGRTRLKQAQMSGTLRRVSLVWQQKIFLLCTDVLLLVLAYWMLGFPDEGNVSAVLRYDVRQAVLHLALVFVNVLCFWVYFEQYVRRRPWWDELREIFRVVTLSLLLASAALFYANLDAGRGLTLWTWGSAFVLLPLGRIAARQVLDCLGLWRRPAYIVGTGRNAQEAYLAVQAESYMGYKILGVFSVEFEDVPSEGLLHVCDGVLPVQPLPDDLKMFMQIEGASEMIVALDTLANPAAQHLLRRLSLVNQNLHIIPSIRGLPLFGAKLSHFFSQEVLFLTVRNNLSRRSYQLVKRIFDLLMAAFLVVLCLPLFLFLFFWIRQDGGPVLYGHTRVGRHGKLFKCWKFRSMRVDSAEVLKHLLTTDAEAKAEWDKDFKLRNDPRITSAGHFLRKSSLDELPQLLNVLKGEMSLVGPRPVVEDELPRYGLGVDYYLSVVPGITGLWQVSGRNDTTYAERVSLDAWYAQNWSLWYDLAILFKTFKVVFGRKGAY